MSSDLSYGFILHVLEIFLKKKSLSRLPDSLSDSYCNMTFVRCALMYICVI